MIEIQCNSCNTRYRIDERVLPEDTPTFKCSRCGHVFTAEPRGAGRSTPSRETIEPKEKQSAPASRLSARKISTLKPAAQRSVVPPAPSPAEPSPPPEAEPPAQAAASVPPAAAEHRTIAPETQPSHPRADDLARPFERSAPEEATPGENLSFDFDDAPILDDRDVPDSAADPRHEGWEVGDEETVPASRRPPTLSSPLRAPEPAPTPEEPEQPLADKEARFFDERRAAPSRAPYVPESGRIHSTGFILGLFVLVAVAFGGGSLLICNAPVASAVFLNGLPMVGGRFAPPIVPARLVAIKDVSLGYRTVKGSKALVITGTVVNVGNLPLHTVELAATLQDSARRPLAGTTIFCGNNPAPAMLGEMTPRELEFLQRLEPPRHFVLKPMVPAPFTMVFVSPPAAVKNLSIAVAKAIPASADELAQTATAN